MAAFLSDWRLFFDAYTLAVVQAAVLGLVGVMVIGRGQVFFGAATAQAATLGVALTMWLAVQIGDEPDSAWRQILTSQWFTMACAVVISIVAAVVIAWGSDANSRGGFTAEEVTAWVFAVTGALTILLLSKSPQGMDAIHRLQASRFMAASRIDLLLMSVIGVVVMLGAWWNQRPIVLWISDPIMAAATGMNLGRWTSGIAVVIGLITGLSIVASGMLYTFGCLVLPAMIAKAGSRNIGTMLFVAPAAGAGLAIVGLAIAHAGNLPPGQVIVATLSCGLLLTYVGRKIVDAAILLPEA